MFTSLGKDYWTGEGEAPGHCLVDPISEVQLPGQVLGGAP